MRLRVLIVDDNPADRALLTRLLRSSDLDVDIVELERGRDLLSMPLNSFDCVLLDNMLPDRDGIDALEDLASSSGGLPRPVIIMSGQGDEHIAARAFKAGANDYMVKDSITPNGLSRTIKNAIDKWRLEDRVRSDWEAQKRALLAAENANRAKTQFLSNMSHELRTPLTAILGFSQIIRAGSFGETQEAWEKYKDYAADIHNSAEHLLDMISDILDVARVESGTSKLSPSDFDPCVVLHETMRMMSLDDGEPRAEVALNLDEAPKMMHSDDRALKMIMMNLISNAIKYTPPEGYIQVRLRSLASGECLFSVADTGIGMDPADIPRLIRPFERYEDSFDSQTSGLGIGLSLVHSLVDLMGGRLEFDTAPGLGVTASVVLPINLDAGAPGLEHSSGL